MREKDRGGRGQRERGGRGGERVKNNCQITSIFERIKHQTFKGRSTRVNDRIETVHVHGLHSILARYNSVFAVETVGVEAHTCLMT